ncbi:nitroreductase [Paracoccus versutus]|uniref:Putative NAD(P)H nitroreductase n=1 Tax=Paracoccus versutus TaxID=34007 RepID=A0AAQ0KPH6_PARVE|nr:nitroreductase [Paracoccus versutus]KGJ11764.1 nitroreductase [Paracoccus versutus]REG56981.1 nitroreductase [Paracoccus versutus]WEJ79854.1 nitroreductase [Paracoccus versutus]
MEYADPATLAFLASRRSHPPKLLAGPPPSREALMELLELAARVPDHGKLEPWRFAVLERATLDRLAPVLARHVLDQGGDEAAAEKARSAFGSPVIVAVVSAPVESPKVPEWEQFLSAGAVCLELVNAALAAGYGAAWLTGPAAEADFARAHLGLAEGERIVGLVHIGRRGPTPPERPRPDVAVKTTFL